ncbi:MAG: thioredoxin [Bacteroidota bacterium]|nr:thioredoxin [Bacteroidota bacterium]
MNTSPSFESHIGGDKPVVVDFFTEWCGPCKMMPPILKQVKQRVGDEATILKMDIDKHPSYAQLYDVRAVPTLIIFRNGKIIWRKSGVTPAHEIVEHLKDFIT